MADRDAFGRLLTVPEKLTRRERVDVVRRLSGELQASRGAEAAWLGRVLSGWLDSGGDLEAHLGVRPPQGSHARPEAIVAAERLQSLLARFATAVGGTRKAARILQGEADCPSDLRDLLAQLRERNAPTSASSVTRARRRVSHHAD